MKRKYSGKQMMAIGMILVSCLLYILLPFSMCLPFSACIIAAISAAMWGSSEILFYVGGAILGKTAMDALKQRIVHRLKRK